MPLLILTTTMDQTDRASEDAFLEGNKNILVRAPAGMKCSAEEFDPKAHMGATSVATVDDDWLRTALPRVIELAKSGDNPELRHICLEHRGDGYLRSMAMTCDKLLCVKTRMKEPTDGSEVEAFSINVSVADCEALNIFADKAFGYGKCELIVRRNAVGKYDSIGVALFSINQVESVLKKDNDGPEIKLCLAKMPRSIGELNTGGMLSEQAFVLKHTATVKHTQKWAFAKKQYCEFKTNGGILEVATYDEKGNSEVRASLGTKLTTYALNSKNELEEVEGAKFEGPLAYVDGRAIHTVMGMVSGPIKVTFGVVANGDTHIRGNVILESEDLLAVFPQAYDKDMAPVEVKYITHKSNKVVETTVEEATKRAIRQNKAGKTEGEMTVVMEKTAEVAEAKLPPTQADIAAEEAAVTVPQVSVDSEEVKMLEVDVSNTEFKASLTLDFSKLSSCQLFDFMDRISCELRRRFDPKTTPVQPSLPGMETKPSLLEKSPNPKETSVEYDIDRLHAAILDYVGNEFKVSTLLDRLEGKLKGATIYTLLAKLSQGNVLGRAKTGYYIVPADYPARFEEFRTTHSFRHKRRTKA